MITYISVYRMHFHAYLALNVGCCAPTRLMGGTQRALPSRHHLQGLQLARAERTTFSSMAAAMVYCGHWVCSTTWILGVCFFLSLCTPSSLAHFHVLSCILHAWESYGAQGKGSYPITLPFSITMWQKARTEIIISLHLMCKRIQSLLFVSSTEKTKGLLN